MPRENLQLSLHILSSSAGDIAFSFMWGIVLLLYWSALPRALFLPLSRYLGSAALALCLTLAAQVVLLTVDMGGTMRWSELWPLLPDVISIHAGSVLRSQLIAAALAAACVVLPQRPTVRRLLVSALLAALTVFKSSAGHAAVDGAFSLREITQCLHLLSISCWAGGILVAACLIRLHSEKAPEMIPGFLRRLSLQSAISIAIVFLSGLCNGWLITEGRWLPLRSTTWGALLIVKIVFVLLALSLGFFNRRDLRRELTTDRQVRLFKRVQIEAVTMLVILCLSGWLSNLSPA